LQCLNNKLERDFHQSVLDDVLINDATKEFSKGNQVLAITEGQDESVLLIKSVQDAEMDLPVALHRTLTQRAYFLDKLSDTLLYYCGLSIENELKVLIGRFFSLTLLRVASLSREKSRNLENELSYLHIFTILQDFYGQR
jgi:hypothetical protein